jgi:hypothetical protein
MGCQAPFSTEKRRPEDTFRNRNGDEGIKVPAGGLDHDIVISQCNIDIATHN